MKLLFLVHTQPTPSAHWRILQFLPHYRELGAEVRVEELSGTGASVREKLRRAADADVTVLQKKLISWWNARILRKAARALVYEFDDAVIYAREESEIRNSATRRSRFSRIVRQADAVSTTNAYLEGLAAEFRPRTSIRVFPNCIDAETWRPRGNGSSNPVRIGWFGSSANLEHLQLLREPLAALRARGVAYEFHVISEFRPELKEIEFTHVLYERARERAQVAELDVAVAPMPDTEWTRGKTPVKVLCYMASGLPTVASDVGSHRDMIQDGANGFLAATPEDWVRELEALVRDADLRRRIGGAARRRIEESFSTRPMARQYLDFYTSVWNRVRGPSV